MCVGVASDRVTKLHFLWARMFCGFGFEAVTDDWSTRRNVWSASEFPHTERGSSGEPGQSVFVLAAVYLVLF